MDRIPFPWTEEISVPLKKEESKGFIQASYAKVIGVLVVLLLLGAFFLRGKEKEKTSVGVVPHLDGVLTMLPLAKGQILEASILKEAPLSVKLFSAKQRFNLLRPEDLTKLDGRLRCKKDIPPNRPIFWNDLEIVPTLSARGSARLIISSDK